MLCRPNNTYSPGCTMLFPVIMLVVITAIAFGLCSIVVIFLHTYDNPPNPTGTSNAFGPISFDHNSTFNFNDGPMNIGWIEFSWCSPRNGPESTSNYHPSFTENELFGLLKYAITVQIGPKTNVPGVTENADYTNTADICSNPVWALNHQYELSFVLDMTSSPTVCTFTLPAIKTNKGVIRCMFTK